MARKATKTTVAPSGAVGSRPAVDGSLDPIAPPPATIIKTHRNRRLLALAVTLITLCSVLGWWVFKQATHTTSVVAARTTIHAGQVVNASDLGTVNINDNSGLSTIPAAEIASLAGKRAQTDIAGGGIVPAGSIANTSVPGKGSSVVGIAIKPGMAPLTNVTVGSPVRVVYLPAQGSTATAGIPEPVVGAVVNLSRSVDGSSTNVDVLVPEASAPSIQSYAAANRVAVVLDSKDR